MKRNDNIIYIVLCVLEVLLFAFVISNQYKYTKIEYSELQIVNEEFLSYTKSKSFYKIKCESGNEYIISYIFADDEHVNALKEGDTLILGIDDNTIVELGVNGNKVLTIEDCHKAYKQHIKTTLIILPMFILLTCIPIFLPFILKTVRNKKEIKHKIRISEIVNQELYEKIQNSIYKENGTLRCNILEQLSDDEVVYTFYKAMIDYLNNQEFILMIDDGCLDDGLALAFYKDDDKLYFEQIFKDESEPFEVLNVLNWYYPFNASVTKEEQKSFSKALNEYALYNDGLVKIVK